MSSTTSSTADSTTAPAVADTQTHLKPAEDPVRLQEVAAEDERLRYPIVSCFHQQRMCCRYVSRHCPSITQPVEVPLDQLSIRCMRSSRSPLVDLFFAVGLVDLFKQYVC